MLTCDSTTRVEVSLPSRSAEHAPLDFSGILLTQQALSTPGHIHNTYILYRYIFFRRVFLFYRRSADFWITSKIYVVSASLILFFAVSPDLSITVLCTISMGSLSIITVPLCQPSGSIRYSRMLIFSGPILHGHVNLFIL